MAKKLNDTIIAGMKPNRKRQEISDATQDNLFLIITPTGRKTWQLMFRMPGEKARTKHALGQWAKDGMNCAAAREAARAALARVRNGEPLSPRQRGKAAPANGNRSEATFRQCAEGYLIEAQRTLDPAVAKDYGSALERLVLPAIGDRPINEISEDELMDLTDDIWQKPSRSHLKTGPADRCARVIANVYKYAKKERILKVANPMLDYKRYLEPREVGRCLSPRELRAIWEIATEIGYPYGTALKILMLTGQRRDEIGMAEWSWLDLEKRRLTLPVAKNRKGSHEILLTDTVLGLFEEAREGHARVNPRSPYIFVNNTKQGPIAAWSALKRNTIERKCREKLGADYRNWRFHDLRHTVWTYMDQGEENAEGEIIFDIALDVIHAVMNQQIPRGMGKAYSHADVQRKYRLKKRQALEWWDEKLQNFLFSTSE
jgi:integrase